MQEFITSGSSGLIAKTSGFLALEIPLSLHMFQICWFAIAVFFMR